MSLAIDGNGMPTAPSFFAAATTWTLRSKPFMQTTIQITVNGNADEAVMQQAAAMMDQKIAMAAPKIVKQSVQSVGREHRDNGAYMRR